MESEDIICWIALVSKTKSEMKRWNTTSGFCLQTYVYTWYVEQEVREPQPLATLHTRITRDSMPCWAV